MFKPTMLVSQTDRWENLKPGGANFIVGNTAGSGLIGPDGMPSKDLRRPGYHMSYYNRAIAADMPVAYL